MSSMQQTNNDQSDMSESKNNRHHNNEKDSSKMFKKDETVPQQDLGNVSINILNDDCLINIFEYLPIIDRIKIERACSRWNCLSKLSWSHFNTLDIKFNTEVTNILLDYGERTNKNTILKNILEKSGNFIKHVILHHNERNLDLRKAIRDISNSCGNISNLDIEIYDNSISDDDLSMLFSKNKNIQHLSLDSMPNLSGKCFVDLQGIKLENLFLRDHKISFNSLCQLLYKLKSLKVLMLDISNFKNIKILVDALISSKCKITDLYLLSSPKCKIDDQLIPLFKNKTNLKFIEFSNMKISTELLASLPLSSIETLSFFDCKISKKVLSDSLRTFTELKDLRFSLNQIKDKIFEAITENYNLKTLTIDNTDSKSHLSCSNLSKLSHLINLQEINISSNQRIVTNHFLKALSQCDSLTSIDISSCPRINENGLSYIAKLTNLQKLTMCNLKKVTGESFKFMSKLKLLNCTDCSEIKEDNLCNVIKSSESLTTLNVCGCNITEKLVEAAVEVKNNSKISILKILISDNNKIKAKVITPYLKIINDKDYCHDLDENEKISNKNNISNENYDDSAESEYLDSSESDSSENDENNENDLPDGLGIFGLLLGALFQNHRHFDFEDSDESDSEDSDGEDSDIFESNNEDSDNEESNDEESNVEGSSKEESDGEKSNVDESLANIFDVNEDANKKKTNNLDDELF